MAAAQAWVLWQDGCEELVQAHPIALTISAFERCAHTASPKPRTWEDADAR
jgi:hypothetical protein